MKCRLNRATLFEIIYLKNDELSYIVLNLTIHYLNQLRVSLSEHEDDFSPGYFVSYQAK